MATTNIGRLQAVLSLDAAGFRRDLGRTEGEIQRAARGIQGIGRSLRGVFAIAGIGLGVRELAQLSDAATSMRTKIALATDGTEEFVAAQARLRDVARDTRAPIETTVDLYQRLRVATRDLGTSSDEVIDLVGGLNAAMAVSGTNAVEASAGLTQLAQALASGRLQGDELRSVLENMPVLAQRLADALGVTVGQLRELGKEGRLNAQVLIPALQRAVKGFNAELAHTPTQIGQAFTIARNSVLEAVDAFNEATGASEFVAGAIVSMGDSIGAAARKFSDFSQTQSRDLDLMRGLWETLKDLIEGTFDLPDANTLADAIRKTTDDLKLLVGVIDSAQRKWLEFQAEITRPDRGGIVGAIDRVLGDPEQQRKDFEAIQEKLKSGTVGSRFKALLDEIEAEGRAKRELEALGADFQKSVDDFAAGFSGKDEGPPLALPPPAASDKELVRARRRAEREAEKLAKADIHEQAEGLQGIDRVFADLAEARSRLDFGELAADIRVGREELEEFALAAARTESEAAAIPALLDKWEESFRDIAAGEGLKEIGEIVSELEAELAEMDLTPAEQHARQVSRAIDEIAASADLAGPELEQLRERAESALEGIRVKAESVTVNISGALAGSFRSTIDGLLEGTATAQSILADIGKGLVGAYADAFAEIIAVKLADFDPVLEQNFLSDIPGIVETGAKEMAESFMGFIDVAIDGVKSLIKWLIEAVNWQAVLSAVKTVGGGVLGLIGLASGGIVTRPTPAIVGEAGPEAVIPLDRLDAVSGGARVEVNVIDNVGVQKRREHRRSPSGGDEIQIVLDAVANDIRSNGKTGRAVADHFGVRQVGQVR